MSRVRGKPEDVLWPVTERTVEAINTNFDVLFRDLRRSADAVLTVPFGGTGQSSWGVGDLLYASDEDELAGLPDVALGNVLLSGGVGAPPSFGKVGLSTHVTGVLGPTFGGTGLATYATGDVLYASAANVLSRLAVGAEGQVLTVLATGVPAWQDAAGGADFLLMGA